MALRKYNPRWLMLSISYATYDKETMSSQNLGLRYADALSGGQANGGLLALLADKWARVHC